MGWCCPVILTSRGVVRNVVGKFRPAVEVDVAIEARDSTFHDHRARNLRICAVPCAKKIMHASPRQ